MAGLVFWPSHREGLVDLVMRFEAWLHIPANSPTQLVMFFNIHKKSWEDVVDLVMQLDVV